MITKSWANSWSVGLPLILGLLYAVRNGVGANSTRLTEFSLARYSSTAVYANNSVIDINLVGEGYPGFKQTDGGALECHTDDTTCCRGIDNPPNGTGRGEWYYPDGTVVPPPIVGTEFYRTRQHMVIRLNRVAVIGPTGVYRCEIPGAGGNTITRYITLSNNRVICQHLQSVTNGFITYTPPPGVSAYLLSTQHYVGTIATYSCSLGYQLVGGPSLRVCGPNGTWNGTEVVPSCYILDCGLLTNPSNGWVNVANGTTFGSVATFSCNTGYMLSHQQVVTCGADGMWSPASPSCILIIDCGPLTDPDNGKVNTSNGTIFGSTATYTCDTGYTLSGSHLRSCGADEIWTSTVPLCNVTDCGPLDHPDNGQVNTSSGTTFRSVAMFSCNTGYMLSHHQVVTCETDGMWSPSRPSCHIIDCGPLTDPDNGKVSTSKGTTFGSTATYTCDTGYTLSGSQSSVCGAHGNWTFSEPVCKGSTPQGNIILATVAIAVFFAVMAAVIITVILTVRQYKLRNSSPSSCTQEECGRELETAENEFDVFTPSSVQCRNLNNGCQWTGRSCDLETHLQSCDYFLIPCSNECESNNQITNILRRNFQDHITNECPKRQYQCPHCEEVGEYQKMSTSHLETCPKVRIPCPNAQCQVDVPRCEVSTHQSTCSYEPVSCKYAEAGCEERPLRKDLKKHEEDDQLFGLQVHTLNVDSAAKPIAKNDQSSDDLQLNAQTTNIHTPIDLCKSIFITAPYQLKLTNFKKYKESSQEFCSPPFYADRSGYKMYLKVYPNGNGDYEYSYVSVFAYLMKGDNDNSLTWPFTGTVTIELLNQLEDRNHHSVTARFENCKTIGDRVTHNEVEIGGGIGGFISHTDLDNQPDKNCQYLKDDRLIFRISVHEPNENPDFCPGGSDLLIFEVNKPLTVYQTLRFSTKLPFIKPVKVLQVSSKGKQYTDRSLGLCIDVPEGAVPEGSLLYLEVGMCLYGPFKFPNDLYPISPILMLCPQTDTKLNQSIKVTLPHIMKDVTNENVEKFGIQVVKADHTGLVFGDTCVFDSVVGDSNPLVHNKEGKGYVTFSLHHFCFVCIRTDHKFEDVECGGYCICPLLPVPRDSVFKSPCDIFYHLCVTYYMDPCFKAIEEQYSRHGYELSRSRIIKFTFEHNKKSILAKILPVNEYGWAASFTINETDSQKITAESVNFWSKKVEVLKQEMELLAFPPSFQINILCQQDAAPIGFMKILFSTSENKEDNFIMNLPLDYNFISSLKGPSVTTEASHLPGRKRLRSSEASGDDCELKQDDLAYLPCYLDNVEFYLNAMELTDHEKAEVRSAVRVHGPHVGMIRCLECWRQHNPAAATFSALRNILIRLGKKTIADAVDKYFESERKFF